MHLADGHQLTGSLFKLKHRHWLKWHTQRWTVLKTVTHDCNERSNVPSLSCLMNFLFPLCRFLCNRLPDEDTDQEELSWKSSCLVLSVAPGFMTPVSISRFKPLTCHEHWVTSCTVSRRRGNVHRRRLLMYFYSYGLLAVSCLCLPSCHCFNFIIL